MERGAVLGLIGRAVDYFRTPLAGSGRGSGGPCTWGLAL